MRRLSVFTMLVVAAALVLTACGPKAAPTTAPADLLEQIKARGYLVVSTDPNYAPQSTLNTSGKRPSDTKCPGDALTTAEMQGFDVDTAVEIGKRLGVETCFVTPDWSVITAGNWADKWDISVGSMTITSGRQKILDFSTPYYYVPAAVAVTTDSGITSVDQLAGKPICVAVSTDYEAWANNNPSDANSVPADAWIVKPPTGMTVTSLPTDQNCAESIQSGRKDFSAWASSKSTIDSAIASGVAIQQLGDPIFYEQNAVAIDKAHSLSVDTLVSQLDKIIQAMHDDGTLSKFSNQWYQADLTKPPAQ